MTNHGALAGLRVLEMAGPPGAYAGRLLAGFGADVLLIEPPDGASTRHRPPFHDGTSLHHLHFNSGKRSHVIDLTAEEDVAAFLDLVAGADVLIEAGQMDALGVDKLLAANPRLIIATITPFGLSGPRKDWVGTDLTAVAASGVMSITGFVGGTPYHPGGEQAFHQAGLAAAIAIVAALGGSGQRIDVSIQEAMVIGIEGGPGMADVEDTERGPRGDETAGVTSTPFQCADGWVAGVLGGRWDARIDWLVQTGMISAEDGNCWRDEAYRQANDSATLDRLTVEMFRKLPKNVVYHEAQARRMAIGPVRTIADLFADPQLREREFFQPLPGTHTLDSGPPFRLDATPWRLTRPAPMLDDHEGQNWVAPARSRPLVAGLPLAGIRVVDFTVWAAGPVATRLLAALGAEVIKVESVLHPDGSRSTVPRPPGNPSLNVCTIFNNFNADKTGITISLENADGREVVQSLIDMADVVVDNFGRDPMPRWGMSVEALRARRPDLIIARSSTVGRTGAEREYIGFGFGIAAMAGLSSLTGFPDEPPFGANALPDFTCNSHHLVLAILAALNHRASTGEGQTIDMSQQESTIAFLGPALLDYQLNGKDSEQPQNRSIEMAPHGVYRGTNERWIAIAVQDDSVWQRFALLTGIQDERFSTVRGRKANEDELDAAVRTVVSSRDVYMLVDTLQGAGIAASPVETNMTLLFHDRHLKERGYYRWIDHPEAGLRATDGLPFRMAGITGPSRPAPRLGEDTDRVLRTILGYDDDRILSLVVSGALE